LKPFRRQSKQPKLGPANRGSRHRRKVNWQLAVLWAGHLLGLPSAWFNGLLVNGSCRRAWVKLRFTPTWHGALSSPATQVISSAEHAAESAEHRPLLEEASPSKHLWGGSSGSVFLLTLIYYPGGPSWWRLSYTPLGPVLHSTRGWRGRGAKPRRPPVSGSPSRQGFHALERRARTVGWPWPGARPRHLNTFLNRAGPSAELRGELAPPGLRRALLRFDPQLRPGADRRFIDSMSGGSADVGHLR